MGVLRTITDVQKRRAYNQRVQGSSPWGCTENRVGLGSARFCVHRTDDRAVGVPPARSAQREELGGESLGVYQRFSRALLGGRTLIRR